AAAAPSEREADLQRIIRDSINSYSAELLSFDLQQISVNCLSANQSRPPFAELKETGRFRRPNRRSCPAERQETGAQGFPAALPLALRLPSLKGPATRGWG